MDEDHSSREARQSNNDSEKGDTELISLQPIESNQAQTQEANNDQAYPQDEVDRQLEAIRRWIVLKFKEAKLVEVVAMVTGLVLVVIGVIGACIYYGQLEEMRHTNELTQQALNANGQTLNATLNKMQGQIEAANKQATASGRSADAAENANRPYVGINGTNITYVGTMGPSARPNAGTNSMSFSIEIKNFGPVPGTSVSETWDVWAGGVKQNVEEKGIGLPYTSFPGKSVYKTGAVGTRDYPAVMGEKMKLTWELTISYSGPKGRYKECEREQFLPKINAFLNLGRCFGRP